MSIHDDRGEVLAGDLRRGFVFVMPVRARRRDRGRWASKPFGMPIDRSRQ